MGGGEAESSSSADTNGHDKTPLVSGAQASPPPPVPIASLRSGWFSPQTTLFAVLFVDLFAVAIVLPQIPQYAKNLDIQASLYGLLGSLYGIAQLLGAPVMGSISDSYGRNVVLLISCVGTCFAYLVMGFTNSVVLFFMLRLPVGYVRQTVTAASAYISDSTSVEQRTIALGKVQMIMSASFLVGPICSGISAQLDPTLKLPIYIATGGFVLEFIVLWWFLPDSRVLQQQQAQLALYAIPVGHPTIKAGADGKMPLPCPFSMDQQRTGEEQAANGAANGTANSGTNGTSKGGGAAAGAEPQTFWGKLKANMATLVRYVRDPVMFTYLLTFFVFTFALTAARESLVISLQNRYTMSGANIGYIWGYVAFLGMVVQGVLIAPLTRRWSEEFLARWCFVGLAISHVGAGLAPTFRLWCATMPFVAFFGGVLRTCVVGLLTKTVARAQVGAMLGLTDFLTSVCRVICPFFGGVLTQFFGANSTDYAVAVLALGMWLYLAYDEANRGALGKLSASSAAAGAGSSVTAEPVTADGANGDQQHAKAS